MSVSTAVKALPARPDLDQYRKQARELLRQVQSGDRDALGRLAVVGPNNRPNGPKLADAQLVLAREHGYASWPRFKTAIEHANLDSTGRTAAFVEAAIRNRTDEARALLVLEPALTSTSLAAALVYGDRPNAERMLESDPRAVSRPFPPRGRLLLHYVCQSGFAAIPERRAGVLECLRLLLAHGADPNATYEEEPWSGFQIPALYGACGILDDAEMAAILIDAGARLDDGESLYHSVEHKAHNCTRLLLERGAEPNARNVLAHQLDSEDLGGLRLLLVHGADPNTGAPVSDSKWANRWVSARGGNALHWAVFRRRSTETIALLLEHGADPTARNVDGVLAYRLALRSGQFNSSDLLRTPDAEKDVTEVDRLLGAACAGDSAAIEAIAARNAGLWEALVAEDHMPVALAAESGDATLLANLLAAGFSPNGRGTYNATALHWAAWRADPECVRLLIARGAEIDAVGADHGTTPLQWAIHGSGNNHEPRQEDFVKVAELLIDAGARLEPDWLAMGSREVKIAFGEDADID